MNIIILLYFGILGISIFWNLCWICQGEEIKEVNNVFDFISYNILWPLYLIKGFIKQLINLFK